MDEIVRFQTLGGPWEVGGADRRRGAWPEDLQCSWDDWGPRTASFVLRRKPNVPQPDVAGLTPVVIEKAGGVWEGFVDQTPQVDEHAIQVECIGWPDHGNDDVEQKTYAHASLADYQDMRGFPNAVLGSTRALAAGAVTSDGGAVVLMFTKGTGLAVGNYVGVVLDLGPGNAWKRATLSYETSNNLATSLLYVRGASTPDELSWTINDAVSGVAITALGASGVTQGTIATASRYVHVFLYQSAIATTGADVWVKIKTLSVFQSTAYEAGDASILKASTVLADALPRLCPQWSPDTSGIDATLLNLPMVAPSAPRNFRELAEALNAPHGYVRKLERGRRFRFKPQPIVPVLAVGESSGARYRDTSKNATRDLYNKAIGMGRGLDGQPLTVTRYASTLPGALYDVPSSPTLPNPSGDVNTTGWFSDGGAITRDTVNFQSSPASIKIVPLTDDTLYTNLSGQFDAQTPYVIQGWFRQPGATGPFEYSLIGAGGVVASGFNVATIDVVSGVWVQFGLALTSPVPVTSPQLQFNFSGGAPAAWVDTIQILSAQPTLLDRRHRVRAQVVSMPSQVVDESVVTAFCDVWLQTHMRTRARGDLAIQDEVRDYSNGAPVHPFAIGEKTGELICLLNEDDPDTGGVGRNVPIASVAYSGNDETAQVAIDDQRDNFEQLVSRYNIIAGGGT